MLRIGQLECVSYGVVCGMSYYAHNEKALINKKMIERKRELRVKLHNLIVETRPRRFWNICFPYFMNTPLIILCIYL
jgi:hypothetical protein